MDEITAVPRWYGTTAFRSSLEADWARALDGWGIEWAYEPAAIKLPSGAVYVPDFWMPKIGTFLEVKGAATGRREKPAELSRTKAADLDLPADWDDAGGLFVVLGLEPVWNTRNDYAAVWLSPSTVNMLLGQCRKCSAWSWVAPQVSLACRSCRRRFGPGDHLYCSGQAPFQRAKRSTWNLAAPAAPPVNHWPGVQPSFPAWKVAAQPAQRSARTTANQSRSRQH